MKSRRLLHSLGIQSTLVMLKFQTLEKWLSFLLPSLENRVTCMNNVHRMDAMTYVRHYGKPGIFITFTCNPNWSEITENLYEGQNSYHRHDLISRVFHLKVKKKLMDLLTKANIFCPIRCHVFTVEWQKRGLPHVHILIWLENRILPR